VGSHPLASCEDLCSITTMIVITDQQVLIISMRMSITNLIQCILSIIFLATAGVG